MACLEVLGEDGGSRRATTYVEVFGFAFDIDFRTARCFDGALFAGGFQVGLGCR